MPRVQGRERFVIYSSGNTTGTFSEGGKAAFVSQHKDELLTVISDCVDVVSPLHGSSCVASGEF